MAKRIFSTIVLWAVIFAVLWFFRTRGALVLITLVSVLTLREFYKLMRASGYAPFDKLGAFCGGLITIAPWVEVRFGIPTHAVLAIATVVFAIRLLGERTPENRVESLAVTLFG